MNHINSPDLSLDQYPLGDFQMIEDDLLQLSFEQLEEIKSRISQIILNKRSARLSAAIKDVLHLLNTHYPDVSLWDFLNELADAYQECDLTEGSTSTTVKQESVLQSEPENLQIIDDYAETLSEDLPTDTFNGVVHHQCLGAVAQNRSEPYLDVPIDPESSLNHQNDVLIFYDPYAFYERLKTIRSEILQHEDARLLWLTNDGSQKTSRLSGKALAELLQETLKKLDRLCDTETEMNVETLNQELSRISEWSEAYLGVSLRRGTLTVITPFATRDLSSSGYSSMLTIAEMQKQGGQGGVHIPFSYR